MPLSRQEPVSCESCRRKKLKCSREHPCSNCTDRGVACVFSGRPPIARPSPPAVDSLADLIRENAVIRSRLNRLEELLVNQSPDGRAERPTKVRRLDSHDETVLTPSTTPSAAPPDSGPPPDTEFTRSYRSDVQWLGAVGTQENTRLPHISAEFEIRVESMDQVVQAATSSYPDRCIMLPSEAEAFRLFSAYVDEIDPMQHVIHVPTVRDSIRKLYSRINRQEQVEANETVLLLSILGSMASYWSPIVDRHATFDSTQSSTAVSVLWLRQTLDIMEHVRRSSSANLATVQAYLITVFLVYHIEGFSPKVRGIFAAAISAAKDLGLHKTDAQPRKDDSPAERVDTEIRRRVWWHAACTDWTFAMAGGPHEGTYLVNPRHMAVNRPRNVTDEELSSAPSYFTRPLSEPTIMGYYLQRIRMSELSREMTDLTYGLEGDCIPANLADDLDAKFRMFLSELPAFLRVGKHVEGVTYVNGTPRAAVLQRYMVNLALHAKRAKFHLPLLLRKEPKYAFCRNACLESARAVIRLKLELAQDNFSLWISNSKLGGFLHLFFYATVVLLMDFCVNRDVVDEVERGKELQQALNTLEQAKRQSITAALFLDTLMSALQKHNIRLKTQRPVEGVARAASIDASAERMHSNGGYVGGSFDNLDLDELWQSYVNSEMSNDWTPLLSDLQTAAWD